MNVAWETFKEIFKKITSNQIFWYAVFAGLAYWGYKRLTKPKEETYLELPLPNSGSGIPKGWDPNPLVEDFHNYFGNGFWDSVFSNEMDLKNAYIAALALTNDQFQTVVQTYNAKYGKSGGTLYKRVSSYSGSLWVFGDQDTKMKNRLIALKLNY